MKDTKTIPVKSLKVGDIIDTLIDKSGDVDQYVMAKWEVIEVTGAYIKLAEWCKHDRIITKSTEDLYTEIPLTKEEFRKKYQHDANYIYTKMLQPISQADRDYWVLHNEHTLDNGWAMGDCYEMAKECKERGIKLIGWTPLTDAQKRHSWTGEVLDTAIIYEYLYNDDDPFEETTWYWVHYKKEWIDDMLHFYFC